MELEVTLMEMGHDHATAEREATQFYAEQVRNGYLTTGPDGKPQFVVGTQGFTTQLAELGFDLEEKRRTGYWQPPRDLRRARQRHRL